MMRLIRFIHKWTGLVIGLFFFLSCLTGMVILIGKLASIHSPVIGWMVKLHRNLFMGDFGSMIIGTVTLLCIIEIITGYCLWWQSARALARSAVKRGQSSWLGVRKNLSFRFPNLTRGLHVAGGFWSGIPLLLMALTGLTWSFGWYSKLIYGLFDNPAKSTTDTNLFHTLHALHVGSWGDEWSRMLWLIMTLLGILLPITGYMLSFNKKRKHRK